MIKIELEHRTRKTKDVYVLTCNDCGYNYLSYDTKRKCPICNKKNKPNKSYRIEQCSMIRGNGNGYGGHPLNVVWHGMLYRCHKPEHKQYKNYGGRGIFVCDEWRNSFIEFFNWAINAGWKMGLQIDRIDNNKGYSPENCRFVTREINCRNQRKSINNKSGYTGVYYYENNNVWTSTVYADNINVCIGSFKTKEEALKARNEFIVKYKLDGYLIQV